jgi:hypothetical protein
MTNRCRRMSKIPRRYDVNGFIQLKRSPETRDLLARDPLAFALLTHIALRARWRNELNIEDLGLGEALIGDFKSYGMTRGEYRTRVRRLVKWRKIEIRTTPKGTIARLISADVFDINEQSGENRPSERPSNLIAQNSCERPRERPIDDQHAANRRPLTNKENDDKKEKRKKKDDVLPATCTSIPPTAVNANQPSSSFNFNVYQNHQTRVQDHVKWPEFVAWCRSQDGAPTERGFRKWLCGQKPQWRNKVGHNFEEDGIVLDGKFFTSEEARQLARRHPEMIKKFRRAVRRGDKIQTI